MDWSDVAVESSEYRAIACARLRRGGGFWDNLVEVDETDRVLECEDVSVGGISAGFYGAGVRLVYLVSQ